MDNPTGNNINWIDILKNGGGAIIGAILMFWIRELFSHNVVVKKSKESYIVNVPYELKDKFNITSNNKTIRKLINYTYRIYHTAFLDIENFKIKMNISKEYPLGHFLEVEVKDPKEVSEVEVTRFNDSNVEIVLKRKFLNSRIKDKSEVLIINIYSDEQITVKVNGGAKGWGISLVKPRENILIGIMGSLAVGGVSTALGILLFNQFSLQYIYLFPIILGIMVFIYLKLTSPFE